MTEAGAAARLESLSARLRDHGYSGVAARPGPGSIPLGDWLDDPDAVRAAIAAHGRHRGFDDESFVASVAAGLFGKTLLGGPISTMVGGWTLDRWIPDLTDANLSVDPGTAGTPVCAPQIPRTLAGSPDVHVLVAAVDELAERCIDGIRRATRVGARLLWGNVALQTRTPFQVLFGLAGDRTDDDYEVLAAHYARVQPLVTDHPATDANGRSFHVARRRTCCLQYQVPGKSYCSTCNLTPDDTTVATLLERAHRRRAAQR